MSYLDIVVDHEVLMLGHERLPPGRGLALDTAHGDGDPVTAPDRLRATDPADTCRQLFSQLKFVSDMNDLHKTFAQTGF